MDVNEQIVKAYFEEVHGYVVKTNHYYKKKRKNGTGPADIDLVLIHPREPGDIRFKKTAICSVKGWQSENISLNEIKAKSIFLHKWKIFERAERNAADAFFGNNDYQKIVILPPIRIQDKYKSATYLKKKGIYLLDFSDILFELLLFLSTEENQRRSYDSETLQVLRIIAINFISVDNTNKLKLKRALTEKVFKPRELISGENKTLTGIYRNNTVHPYIEL